MKTSDFKEARDLLVELRCPSHLSLIAVSTACHGRWSVVGCGLWFVVACWFLVGGSQEARALAERRTQTEYASREICELSIPGAEFQDTRRRRDGFWYIFARRIRVAVLYGFNSYNMIV